MKAFYLTLSIIFTVLILIIAFGNVSSQCSNLHFLFFPIRQNPTIIFLALAALGILTGIFYHAFFSRVFAEAPEDEDF